MIREFIENNLAFSENRPKLKNKHNIFKLGFVDSMFALMLVSFIEEEFAIELHDEDLDIANFSSVDVIVNFVNDKKSNSVSE
jgi:acyl carrier protein